VLAGEYFGRVSIRGGQALLHEAEILGRVRNVAARARFTQPERRLVATDRTPESIEVLTTSQKLAHRIARELGKAYGGESLYRWNPEDGSLHAVWTWAGRRGGVRVDRIRVGPLPPRSGREGVSRQPGRLKIKTLGVEIDPRWRDLLEDSAAKLIQRHPELLQVRVTLRRAKHEGGKRAGVTLLASAPGRYLRAEKRLPTMLASIHAAFASLERTVEKTSQQREPLHGTGAGSSGA
jgi:ribosome-associated translation inhibitor RaiA